MIYKTELFTIHILDLLELLHASPSGEGSLRLMVGGEEQAELDFDDLCLVVRIVSERELFEDAEDNLPHLENVIPMRPM